MRWIVVLLTVALAGCLGGGAPSEMPEPPTSRDADAVPDTPGGPNQTRVGQDAAQWEARLAASPGAAGTCAPATDDVSLHAFSWEPAAPAGSPEATLLTRIEAWTNLTARGALDSRAVARLRDSEDRVMDEKRMAIVAYGIGGVGIGDRLAATQWTGLPAGPYTIEVELCPSTPVFVAVQAKAHYFVDM